MDAPRLTHLKVSHLDSVFLQLKLVHPETIETLQISCYFAFQERDCRILLALSGLKRLVLECFSFNKSAYSWAISNLRKFGKDGIFSRLSDKLKEIHFWYVDLYEASQAEHVEFYSMMKKLKEDRKGIQIYFAGLEMDLLIRCSDEIKSRERAYDRRCLSEEDQWMLYASNPSAHSETLPFSSLNYSLIEKFGGSDLFILKKLARWEHVNLDQEVQDEMALGRWLKSFDTLFSIRFKAKLSQEFYSSILPASLPKIERIYLDFYQPSDYSFLLKFKFLLFARFRCANCCELVGLLFPRLTYLEYLAFCDEKNQLSLDVIRTNRANSRGNLPAGEYQVHLPKPIRSDLTFQSLEDLVQFFK